MPTSPPVSPARPCLATIGLHRWTKTAQILDFDKRRGSVTDDEVLDFLHEKYGINNAVDLQHYSKERRNDILRDCKDFGATIRQLSRLTDLGEKVIRNA